MAKKVSLSSLPKTADKKKKRRGRGPGSGKGGHTVGRGHKGQKARGKVGIGFFGTKRKKSLLKRLPLLRGKGKLKPGKKPIEINLEYLNLLKEDQPVNLETLIKAGIVREEAREVGVKILGKGKVGHSLTIQVPISASAARKVKKAGGKVEHGNN